MANVNPGELRSIITICESTQIKEKGITKYEYNKIARLRAKVKRDKTNQFYDSDTRKKTQSLVFITHKRDFVIEYDNKFVLYNDKYYRIIDVFEMDDHLHCQIFAEVVM